MSLIGPALVDGVILASLYGLLATGVVIIYNTSGVINFAQGALAIFAVFILKTLTDHNVTFGIAALVAILAGGLIGVAIDRLTLAPVRNQTPLNKSITTIGGILITPRLGALDSGTLTIYLIQSLAAALLGGLRSLPRTAIGAVILGMSQELIAIIPGLRGLPGLKFSVAFVVIVVALFINPDLAKTTAQTVTEKVVEPFRARWWTYTRWSVLGLLGLFFLLVGIGSGGAGGWFGDVNRFYWAQVFGDGCVFLSLVVLTGFVGQVSLCQFTFAGFGAFFTAIFTARWGLPFFFAVPLAALCTAPIGML